MSTPPEITKKIKKTKERPPVSSHTFIYSMVPCNVIPRTFTCHTRCSLPSFSCSLKASCFTCNPISSEAPSRYSLNCTLALAFVGFIHLLEASWSSVPRTKCYVNTLSEVTLNAMVLFCFAASRSAWSIEEILHVLVLASSQVPGLSRSFSDGVLIAILFWQTFSIICWPPSLIDMMVGMW